MTSSRRRPWIGLAVLTLPALLVAIDVTALYFAVPYIAADLHPTATEQLWVMDAYGFVLAGLLVTMGALGDRLGRRRLLVIGALGFGAASVLGAYASSAGMLIAARALMGVGGATLMPSTLALIRALFDDEAARGKAIAIWTAVASGGAALGPIVGGALLDHFWWGSVLLINVPVMAALVVLAPRVLPEARSGSGSVDVASAVLSLGAVLPLVWAVKAMALHGVSPVRLAAAGAGLFIGWAFVRRQRGLADPMVDLALFRERVFSSALIVNAIAMFTLVGFAAFTTQYLQSVLGLAPLTAALWTLPAPLSVGVAAPLAIGAAKRFGPGPVVSAGLVVAGLGFVVLAETPVSGGLAVVVVGATLMAAGAAVALTLVTDLVVTAAPVSRTGTAAALTETGSELGGALGVAVLGSVGAGVFHSAMGGGPSTLGGAVGTRWFGAASDAFVSGLHAAAWVGLGIVLVAAIGFTASLRGRGPLPENSVAGNRRYSVT